ncbi:hypothetical protein CIPAW_12G020400 [Carya illinoinensis]|uniref:Uncharacterized protein n=1 Tax=Carya illinoinensis TaxID=32201 RepID=A0A8T1NW41_CARIL|nr:hypothetical protein CIPAW_12G020400 [Carya illinoinensis]
MFCSYEAQSCVLRCVALVFLPNCFVSLNCFKVMFRANLSVLFARLSVGGLEDCLYVLFLIGPVLRFLPNSFGFFNLFRGREQRKFECSFTLSIRLWVEIISVFFSSNSFRVYDFVSSVFGLILCCH